MITVNDFFEQEKECVYKDETYSVRDNGAVMRHAREGKIKRKMDEVWTFGDKNTKNGYMYLGAVRVHRIVAAAFLDKEPSPTHVIDHIDTNKCNNRPTNLRWVTRLENALSNPITRKRIITCCGSIEKFLENPALLREGSVDQNFDWMRTVSPEEAKISKDKLDRWAKEDSMPTGKGKLGEWIYQKDVVEEKQEDGGDRFVIKSETPNAVQINWHAPTSVPLRSKQPVENQLQECLANLVEDAWIHQKDIVEKEQADDDEYELVTKSETPNAVQINWRTPTLFPLCPKQPGDNPLQEYLDNLVEDAVFATNQYGNSMVLKADFNKERNAIFVATYTDSESAAKGYALAKIEYNNASRVYYHESRGTFFGEDGVIKYFTTERGYEWDGEEVFDDLC